MDNNISWICGKDFKVPYQREKIHIAQKNLDYSHLKNKKHSGTLKDGWSVQFGDSRQYDFWHIQIQQEKMSTKETQIPKMEKWKIEMWR